MTYKILGLIFFTFFILNFSVHAEESINDHWKFHDWNADQNLKARLGGATARIVFTAEVADFRQFGSTQIRSGTKTMLLGQCTGSFISRDGYFLTARHCIEDTLMGDMYLALKKVDRADYATALKILRSGEFSVILTKASNGSEIKKSLTAKLIAIGPIGKMSSIVSDLIDKPNGVEQALDFLNQGYGQSGDWVVLKFKNGTSNDCLSVDRELIHASESILSLGYPGESSSDQYKTDGSTLFVAAGRLDSEENTRWLAEYLQKHRMPEPLRSQFSDDENFKVTHRQWELYPEFAKKFIADDVWSATTLLEEGFSGGPTVNVKGELVGINLGKNIYRNSAFINPIVNIYRGLDYARLIDSNIPKNESLFSCIR